MTFADVKPAVRFLGIFLGCYLGLSILYGLWIESLGSLPDGMTREVSREVAGILKGLGYDAETRPNPLGPTVFLYLGEEKIINVFEGCNGLNVMIVFLSFVFAFGGSARNIAWFIPAGFLAIHVTNLARVLWLFWLAAVDAKLFYYFHKYLFTAVIYLIVFALWWFWVTRWNGKTSS